MSNLPSHRIEESILDMSRHLLGADRLVLLTLNDKKHPVRVIARGRVDLPSVESVMPALRHHDAHIEIAETGVATAFGRYDDKSYVVTQFGHLKSSPEETLSRLRKILPYFSTIFAPPHPTLSVKSLPGRSECLDFIRQQMDGEKHLPRRRSFSVIRVSLGSLDHINQLYGWDIANQIIDKLAARIAQSGTHYALIGHSGGGNFILVTQPGDNRTVVDLHISTLRNIMSRPVQIGDIQYAPDMNFAVATYPEHGHDPMSLLRIADLEVEKKGWHRRRKTHVPPDESLTPAQAPQRLEQELLAAIEKKELSFQWQPTTSLSSMKIVSREALLRWDRPGHGLVSAATLIPCAEISGLIERLDEWSLREACRAAANWQDALSVCVNISPTWLYQERLSKLLERILSDVSLDPARLQIDLTEKADFGPSAAVYRELARIRAMGVCIALDDFGSGYSSLERLSLYPVDKIKVSRSFLTKLGTDPRSSRILQHIVHLARGLNITCCAKGVETEQQMAFLASYGYEEVQGFLLGAPQGAALPQRRKALKTRKSAKT
ncbi:hypothetical protein CGLAMM_06755 [Acetobacteraceae bacterium EV16G]|uniref:EAL domain-containing protein n=2 Tax=Sorlinia euscelidii TaxID=3081148 RepID=A0ABU7U6E1_9PROT